ncbi:UxaA family hydrolase [Portibacter marinus]|uniref:UxaA family hydrolase n=1 Tax=Portibacter marinus TaxID=2898660 RepID=UPI001F404C46|nr:altronate dehydratase family protein [Portibacter marinus]
MSKIVLQIHDSDNVLVAIRDLKKGEKVTFDDLEIEIFEFVPAKHKFAIKHIRPGDYVYMYGVIVGKATMFIPKGGRIKIENTEHATAEVDLNRSDFNWEKPDIRKYTDIKFQGYERANGKVGTRNFWLIVPLVFCENRNVDHIEAILSEKLGYSNPTTSTYDIDQLIVAYRSGATSEEILNKSIYTPIDSHQKNQIFSNVDGIRFLKHEGGCGGTREDADLLCQLLARYIEHPNVAGATVMSLGCQNAQISLLKSHLESSGSADNKPVYFLEQQGSSSEISFIEDAVKYTFVGLMEANQHHRKPFGLEHLNIGLECGGSDGFSGISANPTLGHLSDMIVALGGTAILAEFPELNGVEQQLINRCRDITLARKFSALMEEYKIKAESVGSSFKHNPSPGNIKDGLITDAMKSAGAARKGGTSPIEGVLDYGEATVRNGLHLLRTPGNDVESTTGLAGAGANIILFTTGLGTPTGNPITPVIKISSHNELAKRMSDIIDFNAGPIINGNICIESMASELLDLVIEVASGKKETHSIRLGQNDFIPWKRGVSL